MLFFLALLLLPACLRDYERDYIYVIRDIIRICVYKAMDNLLQTKPIRPSREGGWRHNGHIEQEIFNRNHIQLATCEGEDTKVRYM
jgi:hypothetical protein